jgi:hypothetical protein
MLAIVVAVHNTTRAPQIALNRLMVAFLNVGCRCPGRSLRPTRRSDRASAFWPIQDHASGRWSDALHAGNWSKCPGCAMRFRQFSPMFADRVAAWLKVIHRRLCGTSPQSAQAQGIDDFARPPRRSLSKDRPVSAPSEPCSIVATKDIARGLRRGIRRNTSAAFAPARRVLHKARACCVFGQRVCVAILRNEP